MKKRLQGTTHWLGGRFTWADQRTQGRLSILVDAAENFVRARAGESAASLAFYATFSLFPLLAVAVTSISFLIDVEQIPGLFIRFLSPVIPVSAELISQNVQRFLELRGTFSLIGIAGLLWSASNGFATLVFTINNAWEKAKFRSFFERRLLGIALVGGMVALLVGFLIITNVINLLVQLRIPVQFGLAKAYVSFLGLISGGLQLVMLTMIFYMLYRWVPNTRVRRSEAFWSAVFVTVVWEITSLAFRWYLGSGLLNYDVLYGSIAALAVIMLWLNINSTILLYGSFLSAAIARYRARREMPQVERTLIEAGVSTKENV